MQAELNAIGKRLPELDKLIQSAYEDKVLGRIPESVCVNLLNRYETERREKQERRKELTEQLAARLETESSVDAWLDMMQDYAQLEELDRPTLVRLIQKIEISERYTVDDHEERDIHIYYNFVGYIEAYAVILYSRLTNEFYARDTSRKIRAVNKAKGERGVPLTTNVPYGYLKDPDNPRRWKIDPVAADVVRRIFSMCMEGRGPKQIANQLKADKVLTPASYKALQGIKSPNKKPEDPYDWHSSTVVAILERREYTGCTVNFKTYTNSIWDKKQRDNPVEKQAIFPNAHERIIDDDVFEKVQEIRQQRHRMIRTGRSSIFSGLVYCADCGSKMLYGSSNNGDLDQDFFDCSLHRKSKEKCNGHFIRVKVLERLVLKHIQAVMGYILRHEDYFRTIMEEQLRVESCEQIRIRRKRLESNERRIAELKRLFIKIYEDNASGRLTDERYDMLSQTYEAEQKQLEAEAITLQQRIEVQERQNENIEKFIQKAHKYVGIEELDGYALRELVSAVYVDAPDKSSGKRVQHIHIRYDGLGFIPLNELMKKETA